MALAWGHTGLGSLQHLSAVLLSSAAGLLVPPQAQAAGVAEAPGSQKGDLPKGLSLSFPQ